MSGGEKAKNGKYRKFWLDWEKSKVTRKAVLLKSIFNKSQKSDWKAAKYLLECMDSDTYVVENKLSTNVKQEEAVSAFDIREALGILPDDEITDEDSNDEDETSD
ncbi:MAG: hypothetical protein MJ203_01510 [archaeon]|nr:hypothetical protein [archaeon]